MAVPVFRTDGKTSNSGACLDLHRALSSLARRVPLSIAGVHPLARSVDVVLELPDGHAQFDLLDHEATCFVGEPAVRMRDRDHDARVAQLERAESMFDDDVARGEALACLAHDFGQLAFSHRA